ncbi:MAG: glycoside hydrolase family 10 protein [Leptolyngbyaceae cyanobacterium bins.59]|nr:glycoside hydrolase family 10 protein [Leptolyngbyaceae cyanobacterium bins.59]
MSSINFMKLFHGSLRRRFLLFFLAFLLVLVLVLVHPAIATVRRRPQPSGELRGVWLTNIDSEVLFSRSKLSEGLQKLKRLNFNTVYPTVWNWGYTLYPSPVAQRTFGRSLDPAPGLQRRDMLQEIVRQGHQLQMGVIPWFEFGFMAPADSDLARRHPDWLTQRSDGSQIWMEGTHPRVWLNPYHPQVQQFMLDLILEIVTRYDVDGIQFDDHFGLPVEFGYDVLTQDLYRRSHAGKAPPSDFKDAEWKRWRADQLTQFLTRVFRAVKARKPNVLIALAPNPQDFSYHQALADWQTWERQGLIEELIIQVYRNDFERFRTELQRPEVQAARKHIPTGIGILTGLKNKPIASEQVRRQVEEARKQGFVGVSFFFFETLWGHRVSSPQSSERSLFQDLFPNSRRRPTLADYSSQSRT